MGVSLQWPDSPAIVSRDLQVLQQKWEECLGRFAGHLDPLPDDQEPIKPAKIIYEWLRLNPDTAELVRCLDRVPSIKQQLEDENTSFTIWAPTNVAFDHVDMSEAPFELMLQHHISPHMMPLQCILNTPNIPTLARPGVLNGMLPLRLRPTDGRIQLNGYVIISQHNIMATNGIIHLVDQVLQLPLPLPQTVLSAPETQFSRFQQALAKTGLLHELASSSCIGGTLFAPTNAAFLNLGPKVQEFLFSSAGTLHLRALLRYHIVRGETLLSNMFYHGENAAGTTSPPIRHSLASSASTEPSSSSFPSEVQVKPASTSPSTLPRNDEHFLKGSLWFPLPTMLSNSWLHVQVARYGGIISMYVREGEASVVSQDIITLNGVIHAVDKVLLPPPYEAESVTGGNGSLLEVDQLRAALESYF